MAAPDNLRYTTIPLTHGSGAIPALGFGTLIPDPVATRQATKAALETGFRHFDCSERYRNEREVGDAMAEVFRAGKIQRKDVFVTTKLWNNNHRPERVKPAFEASRQRLQLDDVDCYLIHTPFAFQPGDEQDPRDGQGQVIYDSGVTLVETWRALERLVDEGRCKAIGLSNVNLEKLREVVDAARIKPAVVEIESHPYLPEWELLDYCRQQGIVLLAFAALGHGDGAQIAGRSRDRRHRPAPRQNPGPGRARLGGTARHRAPDHLGHAQPHRGELRAFDHTGRRHAGDPRRRHDEDAIQYRRGDRRARVHSQSSVKARSEAAATTEISIWWPLS